MTHHSDVADAPTAIELGQLYITLHARLHRLVDDAMVAGGASFSRTKLLKLLQADGPLNQSAIATHFGFAPRSVTDLVDGLEREGLAERLDDPADRRSRLVKITDAGMVALQSALKIKEDLFEQIFSALKPSERTELSTLLHTVYDSLSSQPGEAHVR